MDRERLSELLETQTRLPEGFHIHPKLEDGIQRRLQMARGEQPLDWSSAEGLAFASLAAEGIRVRLSGQDSERGTFSQRHSVLHDVENGRTTDRCRTSTLIRRPLRHYNSPLSEAGVLGFEYGYSLDCPDGLTIWEAQYGDFVNAAQVIVDQFMAAAEDKWQRLSGVVFCCLTVSKVLVLSIPARVWKDSSNSRPKTICRSPAPQHRRNTFISFAARC